MTKTVRHFEKPGHGALRVAGLPMACPAPCCRPASRARIAIAPARSFAKVLRLATGWQWTAADNLPQLPQLALKKLGQRKPNKHAMPQLPQPAPTIFDMNLTEKDTARRAWCAGRESTSRRKTGFVQRNRAT